MMKSNMRACGNRIIAFCLLLTLIIGMLPINAFATNSEFHKQTMTLNSNVSSDMTVELYEHENMFYISIEDMGKLTRCQVKTDGDCITVQQGFNSGTFDYSDQLYSDMYNDVSFDILRISDGEYAVPALMFLNYFGATAFIDDDTLFAFMPVCTAWEALNINYSNTLLNLNDVYDVESHLWWDLVNELLIGEMKSEIGYMRDAYNAVMNVDMEGNEAVQRYVDTAYSDLSTYLDSDKGSDIMKAALNRIEGEIDITDDSLNALLFDPAHVLINLYYELEQSNLIQQAMDIHKTFPDVDLSPIGKQFSDNLHKQIETDKMVDNISNKVDWFLSCASYAVSVAQSVKRVHDADNIVYKVMGQENMNRLGITAKNGQWTAVADSYENNMSIALSELVMKAEEKLVEEKSEEALAAILDLMSGTKGAGKLGLELGRLILELDPIANKQNDAIRAEIIAILLSELQFEVASILKANLENIVSEPRNPDYYKQYLDTQLMYCRTSIAMYNSLIEVVRVLTWKGEDIAELFQKKVDLLSLYMYRLTTLQYDNYPKCIPMDLNDLYDQMTNAEPEAYSTILKAYQVAENLCRNVGSTDDLTIDFYNRVSACGDIVPSIPVRVIPDEIFGADDGIAYALEDLNKDGTEELLIGTYSSNHFCIFDIFTLKKSGLVRLCSSDATLGGIAVYSNAIIEEYEEFEPSNHNRFYRMDSAGNIDYLGEVGFDIIDGWYMLTDDGTRAHCTWEESQKYCEELREGNEPMSFLWLPLSDDSDIDEALNSYISAPKYEDEITGTYLAVYQDVRITITAESDSEYSLTYTASGVKLENIPLAYFNKNTSTEKSLMFLIDDYYPEYSGYVEVNWSKNGLFPYSYNSLIEGLDDTDGYYSTLTKT